MTELEVGIHKRLEIYSSFYLRRRPDLWSTTLTAFPSNKVLNPSPTLRTVRGSRDIPIPSWGVNEGSRSSSFST